MNDDMSSVSAPSSIPDTSSSNGDIDPSKGMTPRNIRIIAGFIMVCYILDILRVYDSLSSNDSTTLKSVKYTRIGIDSIGILLSLVFAAKPDKWQNKYLYWSYIGLPVILLIIFMVQRNLNN